jgi:hypothetical protein
MKEFNQKKFPVLRLHEDFFEVKDVDYWEFRKFNFNEVTRIEYYHTGSGWYAFGAGLLSHLSPYRLKITKSNGADWWYDAPWKFSKEFAEFLREIVHECGLEDEIPKY